MSAPVPLHPVPLHPEPTDDDAVLRWVVPADALAFVGAVAAVPAALQTLLDDGTLAQVLVEPAAVRTRLGRGTWQEHGARVRTALQDALAAPAGWVPVEAGSRQDVLRAAVAEVLAGEVGGYIRSHGGQVSLVAVHGDDVEVAMSGACSHCPASDLTLTTRLETAVRARYPSLGAVTARESAPAPGGRTRLGLPLLRRR